MIENSTKAKLASGETVLGCFLTHPQPSLAELIALQGWDFLVFDAEHGPLQPHDVQSLCLAAEYREVTPIVRVTTNQPHIILRFLDTGAHGVHVPWVNTPEEVESAVSAVKYGPRGRRGLAGSRASDWGQYESIGEYTIRANRETMVIIHIETIEAVEAIEEYVQIDGVDVLFLGPTDLSHSIGHPGELDHPDVVSAMDRVADVVTGSDKVLGVYAGSEQAARDWVERGARYVATGLPGFIRQGMQTYLSNLRG